MNDYINGFRNPKKHNKILYMMNEETLSEDDKIDD